MFKVNFNEPPFVGAEMDFIRKALKNKKISGDGAFTKKCENGFKRLLGIETTPILTSSCTHALEMVALIEQFSSKDEIIVPSFTFVSSALAYEKFNISLSFADVDQLYGTLTLDTVKSSLQPNTKAVVYVHYGGRINPEFWKILEFCRSNNLILIEDAAQCVGAKVDKGYLGCFGDYGTFSFHETKNLTSAGEGGMLVVKNKVKAEMAFMVRDKGTNRREFFLGQTDKYTWKSIGSSYLMSDISAAYLFAQIKEIKRITDYRNLMCRTYQDDLLELKQANLIWFPEIDRTYNGHMFYILSKDRDDLISYLRQNMIEATFHYLPLEQSPYIISKYKVIKNCKNSAELSNNLIRLPLHLNLKESEIRFITTSLKKYYNEK